VSLAKSSGACLPAGRHLDLAAVFPACRQAGLLLLLGKQKKEG